MPPTGPRCEAGPWAGQKNAPRSLGQCVTTGIRTRSAVLNYPPDRPTIRGQDTAPPRALGPRFLPFPWGPRAGISGEYPGVTTFPRITAATFGTSAAPRPAP